MGVVVAKLGSAIVADEEGTVRRDVLESMCVAVAEERSRGRQVVLVTSGAIAIGMRAMGLPVRPSRPGWLELPDPIREAPRREGLDEMVVEPSGVALIPQQAAPVTGKSPQIFTP